MNSVNSHQIVVSNISYKADCRRASANSELARVYSPPERRGIADSRRSVGTKCASSAGILFLAIFSILFPALRSLANEYVLKDGRILQGAWGWSIP